MKALPYIYITKKFNHKSTSKKKNSNW